MTSIMLLDCFAKELFSLQDYLFLHFTILGIAVTLIAITTSLTKEVRQDLIWEYYLKSGSQDWKFLKMGSQVELYRSYIAGCILFGLSSGASLATVVGVLIEVPVMLMLVKICLKTKHIFN